MMDISERRFPYWREAATLIITAAYMSQCYKYDYSVLMLQRNFKAKFFPGSYVYPGGVVSSIDYSADWIPLYKKVCRV